MKKHFYSNIIEIDSLVIELDQIELSKEQKDHLTELIHSNLYHEILDVVLSELEDEDKKVFLINLSGNDHNKIWKHLKSRIEDVEKKIKKATEDFKKELSNDIKRIKK